MDLSNLQPAEGSRQSDNFRRGRESMVQEMVKLLVRVIRDRKLVPEHLNQVLKASRCLYTDVFLKRIQEQKL